jgi:hypothetical protein
MKLKLGFMTNQELADWFGITLKTLTNTKKIYMERLEPFAKFKTVRGGVVIEEISIEKYIKNLNDDVRFYLEEVKKANDNLASIAGISEALIANSPEFHDCSFSTLKRRMRKAGIKAFGVTVDPESKGIYGSREYAWVIKLYDKPNHYRHLTAEENELFLSLIKAYCADAPEKIQQAALLEEAYRSSDDMTKEEYFTRKEALEIDYFVDIIRLFK